MDDIDTWFLHNPTKRECVDLLEDGKTIKQISEILGSARSSVWQHLRALRHKFGVKNNDDLLEAYGEWKLVAPTIIAKRNLNGAILRVIDAIGKMADCHYPHDDVNKGYQINHEYKEWDDRYLRCEVTFTVIKKDKQDG